MTAAVLLMLCAAAQVATGHEWFLQSTHTRVIPKLTEDVTIRCAYDYDFNTSIHTPQQLTRIRLQKLNEKGLWNTFARIVIPSTSHVDLIDSNISPGIEARGKLGNVSESFLSITWQTALDDTVGIYRCEVDAFVGDGQKDVQILTNLINIVETVPSSKELIESLFEFKNAIKRDLVPSIMSQVQVEIEDSLPEARFWPRGEYAMLSPASGCPDTPYDRLTPGNFTARTETESKPNHTLSVPSHLHQDTFESNCSQNTLRMRFCRHSVTKDSYAQPWPKGSYCIHNKGPSGSRCLPGFKFGNMGGHLSSTSKMIGTIENADETVYLGESSRDVRIRFCCRNDGSPQNPIILPTSKPFYLYRYKGQCQAVKNMDVTEEWIHLQTDGTGKDYYYNDIYPDGSINDIQIQLCYYSKGK